MLRRRVGRLSIGPAAASVELVRFDPRTTPGKLERSEVAGAAQIPRHCDDKLRPRPRPRSSRRSTRSAGSSKAPWTSSRSTSAGLASCSAPRHPPASSKRSTDTSASTTRSVGSCTPSRSPPATTQTASASSVPCAPPAAQPGHTPAFPPNTLNAAHEQATQELLFELLPPRRLRTNPRVVKRKMSNYNVKRPEHRNPPKPANTQTPPSWAS